MNYNEQTGLKRVSYRRQVIVLANGGTLVRRVHVRYLDGKINQAWVCWPRGQITPLVKVGANRWRQLH